MDVSTDKKDFFLFAFIHPKSNFKGDIKIKVINNYNIDFKSVTTIFIEEDNILIPYKLKNIKRFNKNNLTLIIDDINTELKAHQQLDSFWIFKKD